MLLKLPKTRKFAYRPLFYKPTEEEPKQRIKFRRYRTYTVSKKRSILVMLVLIIIIIFLLDYWLKLDSSNQEEFKFEDLKIEEIR